MEIKKGIYWVGVVDWNMRTFHGHTYTTKRGTTYNAYLIIDDKITLIDTVLGSFSQEFLNNIREIIDPAKINYIIANHVETDHSGAMPELMKICPQAKVFGTAKCKEGLEKHYHQNWDFQIVKTGDKLNLGKRELTFFEAPMIHWPDSMFTYCASEKLLLPNDAFGQHLATSERFDDQVSDCILMDEAEKYYANILWPLAKIIAKKLDELGKLNLEIDMIAPSHGIIWRKDPNKIVNAYLNWTQSTGNKRVTIFYETMWSSTEKMAREIAKGIEDAGVEVSLFDVAQADRTELIKELFESKGYLVGSSTHDNDMLPTIAGVLEFLKGLRPQGKVAGVFGSFGWAGGAVKNIESLLQGAGINLVVPGLGLQYVPDQAGLRQCYNFGKEFIKSL